jgi:hypothetical protein
MDLGFKLNNLTKDDIKNAYGSAVDYTASKVGQMVGRKNVVDAQNKINSIQIKNVLDNLSQLKGASSDKEMAQMIKDFPAYTASPDVMEKWVERAAKTISGRSSLKSLLKRIDTADELRDLIVALLKNINADFVSDKTKVKSVLFQLRNRIKEAETKDTTATIDAILKDNTIVALFQKINTIEEAIQLILRNIIPYLNPSLLKDKTKLKNAIISAANTYNKTSSSNTSTTPAKTSSTSNTSSTGATNVNYTLTKENKNMKKPLLNEEFSRMQKIAGIIK